jgi:hypothetical protein
VIIDNVHQRQTPEKEDMLLALNAREGFEDLEQLLWQGDRPGFAVLGIRGRQNDAAGIEIHFWPRQLQDLTAAHTGVVGCGQDRPQMLGRTLLELEKQRVAQHLVADVGAFLEQFLEQAERAQGFLPEHFIVKSLSDHAAGRADDLVDIRVGKSFGLELGLEIFQVGFPKADHLGGSEGTLETAQVGFHRGQHGQALDGLQSQVPTDELGKGQFGLVVQQGGGPLPFQGPVLAIQRPGVIEGVSHTGFFHVLVTWLAIADVVFDPTRFLGLVQITAALAALVLVGLFEPAVWAFS